MLGLQPSVRFLRLAVVYAALASTAHAQTAPTHFDELAKVEGAPNAAPSKRVAPLKSIGNPATQVSPDMQASIGAPYPSHFNADPKDASEWHALADQRAKLVIRNPNALKETLGVKVEETAIAGFTSSSLPNDIPAQNQRRLLLHVHDGGYFLPPY